MKNKRQDTLQIRKTPWHGVTKQPPALNRMKKSRVWQAIVPGTQTKPQDTLQIRKTPWRGVTKQPPAVPLPGPNGRQLFQAHKPSHVTPEPNEKIKGLAGNYSRHTKQATRHPSNQENTLARRDETFQAHKTSHKTPFKSGKHLARRDETASCQTSLLNRMKKSRVWQAIVPGTQNKPQDTLQIRKTPWHGVTKQPPAVPLPGPNVTPEPNEKIKGLAGNCSRHTKQATRHPSNQENTLARRDETASCRPFARAKRHS